MCAAQPLATARVEPSSLPLTPCFLSIARASASHQLEALLVVGALFPVSVTIGAILPRRADGRQRAAAPLAWPPLRARLVATLFLPPPLAPVRPLDLIPFAL